MKRTVPIVIYVLLTCVKLNAQGHYSGGSFNPNDYFAPPPGFIIPIYYSYASMDFYNADGKRSDELIRPVAGDPTSLSIEQNVRTNSFIAMIIYGGKKKILNANWGMMLLPMVNNPTANITLDYYSSQTGAGSVSIPGSSWGLGDAYFQPIWLTWTSAKWTYGLSYGVFMPAGRYRAGDAKNVGLGYWSHNIRGAGKYQLKPQISLTMAATYEVNTKQKDVDFREAPHFTFDMGGCYVFAKGHEAGLFTHYTTQTGDDRGMQGSLLSDRVFGIGAYGSYWIKPLKWGILARYTQNFGARNRFAGSTFSIGVNFLFLDLPETQ